MGDWNGSSRRKFHFLFPLSSYLRSHWNEGAHSFQGPQERSIGVRAEASVCRMSGPTGHEEPAGAGTFSLDPRALGIRVGRVGAERTISTLIIGQETQGPSEWSLLYSG